MNASIFSVMLSAAVEAGSEPTSAIVHISTLTRVVAVIVAGLFLLLVLELVRRRALRERYTVIWFVAGIVLMALAIVPAALESLAALVGIADPTAALFAVTIGVIGLLVLNITVVVSRQSDAITSLAQEVALLRARLDRQDDHAARPDRAGGGDSSDSASERS